MAGVDGTKCAVVDNTTNSFDYLGSLKYTRNGSTRTLENTDFGGGRIVYSGGTYSPYYYITDHLGSVRVITNNSGAIVEQNDYYPFGGKHANANYPQFSVNKQKFNGKELQTTGSTGFLDYGARMYDDVIGRWGVVDPLSESYKSWSQFNYGINNPIRFIDPNGKEVFETNSTFVFTDKDAQEFFRQLQAQNNLNEHANQDDKNKNDDLKNTDNKQKTGYAIPLAFPFNLELFIEASLLRLINVVGILITIPGDTPIDHQVNYIPPPRNLPGFPGATKVGAKAGRARWTLPNGDIAEWDSQHGDVEVYDKTGKNHKGSFDPKTGKQNKPSKKGRTTKK